jgi:membrane protein implicated in regulation of membrane protease activity
MDPYLYWILTAIALVIVELLTGTFYLLVLSIAAAAGGALAYFDLPFWMQAAFATFIAALGVVLGHRYRVNTPRVAMQSTSDTASPCSPGSTSRKGSRASAIAERCGTPKS